MSLLSHRFYPLQQHPFHPFYPLNAASFAVGCYFQHTQWSDVIGYYTSSLRIMEQLIQAINAGKNKYIELYTKKPPFAVKCCHLANDLTNFTGDRQTNRQTDGQHHRTNIYVNRIVAEKQAGFRAGIALSINWFGDMTRMEGGRLSMRVLQSHGE